MEENNNKPIIGWEEQGMNKTSSVFISDGFSAKILTTEKDGYQNHLVIASSIGGAFIDVLTGRYADKALELLLVAVNNRTKERDYFRLYCDMLDGSITEKEFDNEIERNLKDYVVDNSCIPSREVAELALRLSEHIKSVSTIEDLNSLFSFDADKVNSFILENNND